jgi:hypothetical protein
MTIQYKNRKQDKKENAETYYCSTKVCFMYLQLQKQITKKTTTERKKVGFMDVL